jgi:GT2 family glycosyltransferase
MRIDVLMTSHDRRAQTLDCLRGLARQSAEIDVRVVLVDADSTDGTPEAVLESFPNVVLRRVSDSVYWGEGMRLAGLEVRSDADFHLWLNDDVVLDAGALANLLELSAPDRVVVGKLRDAQGRETYGGLRAGRLKHLTMTPVPAAPTPIVVDTMNGNVVLIGREVVERVGLIRGDLFPHAFGDIDFAFRARRAGFEVIQAPGTVGVCARNPPPTTYTQPTLAARWRAVTDVKALPPRMWWRACLLHGGVLAPVYFVMPYLKVVRRTRPSEAR